MPHIRRKRILFAVGCVFAGVVIVGLLLPVWLPWVLSPVAGRAGARYSRYARDGYGRFTLFGFSYTNQGVRLEAARVEGLVPSLWVWHCLAGVRNEHPPMLRVSGWRLEFFSKSNQTSSATHPVLHDVQDFERELRTLQKWVPSAVLSQGTVRVGKTILGLPAINWSGGGLRAELELPAPVGPATLEAQLARAPYRLEFQSGPLHLKTGVQVSHSATVLNLESTSLWWSNRIDFKAQFGREDRLPESATLRARDFRFPAEMIELKDFGDVNGNLTATWKQAQFELDLAANSRPLPAQNDLPPLQLELHARGDTNAAIIHSAVLTSPWATAELSRELILYFRGRLLREPASLKLSADLARQPWYPLHGTVAGQADFTPSGERFPSAKFRLSGAQIGNPILEAKSLAVAGVFDWPSLEVVKADAGFEDGSTALVRGKLDLRKKVLDAGHVSFEGALGRRWLPPGYSCQEMSLTGDFHGPLSAPVYRGRLIVTNLSSPVLRPVQFQADWQGERATIQTADLELSLSNASLSAKVSLAPAKTPAAGAAAAAPGRREEEKTRLEAAGFHLDAVLRALSLRTTNGQPALELTQPCRISVSYGARTNGLFLSLSPFDLVGMAGELHAQGSVAWPRSGNLRASIQRVRSSLFAGFLKADLASLEVRHLEAAAAWSNGPAAFGISFSAAALAKLPAGSLKSSVVAPSQAAGSARAGALRSGQQAGGMPVTLVFACAGNDGGVVISNFFVSSGTSAVAAVHGFLPLSLNPGLRTNLLQLDFQKPLQLTANVYPEPSVWNEVAERTGMALRQPRLSLDLSGTWSEPRGTVHLAAQAVEFRTTKAKLPTLTELVVVAELERQRVRLTQGQVRVQAQPLTLTAELPLGVGFWNRLNERRLPDLEQATAHLRVQDAELSAFAELFPKILSPQGQLNLELDLLPGFKLNGEFVVQGARSRPLATLGPIRDINLKMKFHERTLELEQATAKLGPSIVTLAGLADFQGTNWMKEGIPSLDITLRGTNVPLARQPESVIRSDLNLRLVKKIGAAPLITGTARLRDSFYLSDLAALAPGKVAGPGLRPPFFSLDEPFLAGSKLNVAVTGVRFLKVRSPVFNGEVSANLKLQGTLQDPIALGDMRIDSGTVNFPFASLQVQQGFVTLASEDPYRPQLALSATSRQFGYDIKMEVSGSADAPILQFSSSPPLSSEQILLLVTAGEIPRQEQVLSAQQRAQTFALFLGKDLLSKLGLGDQGEQRLIIHSGQELTQTGKPTYNIEYKLTRRWSLVGEQDQFNDLNAGMKWRVYSK